MKKHLLLALSLFFVLGFYAQNNGTKVRPSGIENSAKKISERFAALNAAGETEPTGNSSALAISPDVNTESNARAGSVSTFTTGWKSFTGSMNVFGMLVSTTKPLHYNDELNVISFIHRKSATYSMVPQPAVVTAQTGGIVAMISENCGNTWDSTLVWNNPAQWARYPQGAIYNPVVGGNINTNINNAYIAAMGPVTTNGAVWTGNFFASKQLGVANYNNIASQAPGGQQFLSSTAPYGSLDKTVFSRYSMASTDDGKLHALGLIEEADLTGYRGARVIKESFNSGVFTWIGDSIIPIVTTAGDGSKNVINGLPYMAWNESGTVGYIFHIGGRTGQTDAENRGFQPVIVKTTDGGITWVPINGIDFTQPSFVAPVMNHLVSTRSNTNVAIPFFNVSEGISAVVDKNNDLHIVATLQSSSSSHSDSLGFTFRFNNSDGETYKYPHIENLRPYLYDFIGGASPAAPWKVVLIDSMSSEAPGGGASAAGFNFNLWLPDATTGNKVVSDARIQASRTSDGNYVVYTYTESDTTLTTSSVKWNQIPNIKARCYNVTAGSLSPTKINVSRPGVVSLRNPNVANRAFFHYIAPTCVLSQAIAVGANGPAISLPITVSNNGNLSSVDPVAHRFSFAALNFGSVAEKDISNKCISVPVVTGGISENHAATLNSFIYPNPAKNSAILSIDLSKSANVHILVLNMVGQVVRTSSTAAVEGNNSIPIDLSGLSKGIYMTAVKVNNVTSTKKMIIE